MTETNCNLCNKKFKSLSTMAIHSREKHTRNKTTIRICKGCSIEFHSVKFNEAKDK
jgi:hypothetical protein